MENNRATHSGFRWMTVGILLLFAAAWLMLYNGKQDYTAGQEVQVVLSQWEKIPSVSPDHSSQPTSNEMTEISQMQPVFIDSSLYLGVLNIPRLSLSLPIASQCSVAMLKKTPCCYSGSYLDNTLVIAGHNYRSHFGRLSQLSQGDAITFTDGLGYTYGYQVTGFEIIGGQDSAALFSNDWDLTLLTCTKGGANRFLVRCRQIDPLYTSSPAITS